jgi:hypothetical protein
LKILGEVQGILIDEASCDRSSYVLGKEQDAKSVSKVSLVAAEDSAPMSADVPPTAMDEAAEVSSEEEPSKEDSPADPQGEGKPAAEGSAPAPVHVTQRATEHWPSLAGSGKLFEKACPRMRTY